MDKFKLNSVKEKNKELLNEDLDKVYNLLLENIERKNELVTIQLNKENKNVTYGQLLLLLIFTPIHFLNDKEITLSDLFLPEPKSNPVNLVGEYFNKFINDNEDIDSELLQRHIADILETNAKIMYKINEVVGNTISLFELFKMIKEDKELYDIINFNIDESLQYHDMEQSITDKFNRFIEKLHEHGDNCYVNLLKSVSPKQFQQVCINIGLKPDLYGNIYPEPINTSFIRGLRNEKDYFINAMGARKALVVNAKYWPYK